jgi:hypothetical protein
MSSKLARTFGACMNVAISSASHRQGTITTPLFFACGGLVLRICYIVLSNGFLIVPYSKILAYNQCPVYCTKVFLVWIFLANRWGSGQIVSWCSSCVYHKWQEVKECIARRKLSLNWGICRKNSRKCLAYLAVTAGILLESTCTATRPLKLRTHKTVVDQGLDNYANRARIPCCRNQCILGLLTH